MKVVYRFGNKNDYEMIIEKDQNIRTKLIEWKLNNQEIVVAEAEGSFIGYLRIEYLWSKYPYIGLISVESGHRRQGIGSGLLLYIEEELKKNGIKALYSSSQVNEALPQEWHRRMGFVECGMINGINEGNIGEVFFYKEFR
jgi:N-acetylglutamate synthase-like GNAT family acetyltransferase